MASDQQAFNIFLIEFPTIFQIKLNDFGNYLSKKAGVQPQLIYTLGDVNALLRLYREKVPSAGRDEKVIQFEDVFYWELIKAGQPKSKDSDSD